MSMIINDNIDAKIVIPFQSDVRRPNDVQKSIDTSITELIEVTSAPTSSTVTPTKTTADWAALCSQSLDILGYPNSVNAAGLKVLPYSDYFDTYSELTQLVNATSTSIEKLSQQMNDFNSTFLYTKNKFTNDSECQAVKIYSQLLTNFETLSVSINDIFASIQELHTEINSSANITKID